MKIDSLRLVALVLGSVSFLGAQAVDDTQLKQVIILGRHNVRAPAAPNSILNNFSAQPYPVFGVDAGILTANGAKLETMLGGYYRLWLTKEGLLTGNDAADAPLVYFRASVLERTVASAQALAAGLLPAASVNVNHYGPTESDPLFDPIGAGVARLDLQMAVAAVTGRLGGNGDLLTSAYASELALMRSVLFGYPASETPVPARPTGKLDVTTIPIIVTAGTSLFPVNLGGLTAVAAAVDPFIMEYAEGLPVSDVGWGQLTAAGISQLTRLSNLTFDLGNRTPYLAGVESSNLASHVARSMVQAATRNAMTGSLGSPSTKVIVLVASDGNLAAFAGLFQLNFILPGYQPNYLTPGGAVVLQLRQSQSTGEYIVRASYVAQTLDQLRNQTALTLAAPPASAPIFIPGCSDRNAAFDCPLEGFVELERNAIDSQSADLVN
jgi:4-phytase/acid phosphatase